MSQHNYAYGPPEGYYQRQPDPSLPYPAYSAPAYHPSNSGTIPTYTNESATNQAFDYNRNVIPGLGLGIPSTATEWQQQWKNPPSVAVTAETPSTSIINQSTGATEHMPGSLALASPPPGTGAQNDAMDEGELSEGELEDIYEPKYPEDEPAPVGSNNSLDQASHTYGSVAVAQIPPAQDASEMELTGLDRGGSYSPYLSPHEVEQIDSAKNVDSPNDNPRQSATGIHHSPQEQTIQSFHGSKSLVHARKQAQDSILRLWPLNVRYQDYVNEGIDPVVLQDLFRDLGLDLRAASSTRPRMSDDTPKSDTPHQTNGSNVSNDNRPDGAAQPVMVSAQKSDPSESRKDRIARLLAAKGSKQTAVPDAAVKTTAPLPTPSSVSKKALSEKSKLLRRKMEALERAREAQAQKSGQASGQSQGDASDTQDNLAVVPPDAAALPLSSQTQDPQSGASSRSSPPIPGLFLSSTEQASSATQQKRPAASDLNDAPEASFKRPFGQSRQSQPFLIDVSDDEDDEAMDLDSPELRPVSANRPSSPFKIPAYRDLHTAPTNHPERHLSSPMPTTPIPPSGRGNLETMNKEIEVMKRKIAEAEARKKTRVSRPASPAVGNTGTPQEAGCADSSVPLASTEASDAQASPSQTTGHLGSERLPKVSERRGAGQRSGSRSRSRAASERLPIIEAHRREQLLKLQALQSQVRKMEKEIEESMQEEEKLREEAIDASDSDEDENAEIDSSALKSVAESTMPPTQATGVPLPESTEESRTCRLEEPASHEKARDDVVPAGAIADEAVEVPKRGTQDQESQKIGGIEQDLAHPGEQDYLPAAGNQQAADHGNEPLSTAPEAQQDYHEDDVSDGYEPPEAESSTSSENSEDSEDSEDPGDLPSNETASGENPLVEWSDNEMQGVSTTTPITQPISTGQQESKPPSPREGDGSPPADAQNTSTSSFIPYETPLRYFRAYRFHPSFSDSVPGGLRSLTYSNKIDVKKELCPDQLAGTICPRGEQCDFQHFEGMQAPDDQILLQLGAYGNYEGEKKQEYINGLRQLLTDFRNRKIKDFKTISQGIIDYRVQFRKDPSKILPIGNVSI